MEEDASNSESFEVVVPKVNLKRKFNSNISSDILIFLREKTFSCRRIFCINQLRGQKIQASALLNKYLLLHCVI